MMPNVRLRVLILLLMLLLLGATLPFALRRGGKSAEAPKPHSKGLPYELVLIVPRALYQGELKDSLQAVLQASTPVLPQHEPLFRLNTAYAEGNLTPWRTFRLRIVVEVDAQAFQPALGIARNTVAQPQLELKATARSAHELAQFIGANKERIQDLLVDAELEVEAAALRRRHSKPTAQALQRLAGFTVCVPPGLKASKEAQDFLWTGTNLNDKDQNFVFYSFDWDGKPLTDESFVAHRDSVMKANIPGSRPDQWMQTARNSQTHNPSNREAAPLISTRTRSFNQKELLEVHGLWEMRNGALGGPFVSLAAIDTAARRVIVTEGFIYSPHSPKRPLMRQMEAALRTLRRL